MPLITGFTVSADSKKSDGNYGSDGIFLSATIIPLPRESLDQVAEDLYLALKARCNQLLKLDPEKCGFKTLDELQPGGIVSGPYMEEPDPEQGKKKPPEPPVAEPNAEALSKIKEVVGEVPQNCLCCGAKPGKGDPNVYTVSTLEMHESKHWQVLYHKGCKMSQKESQIKVRRT